LKQIIKYEKKNFSKIHSEQTHDIVFNNEARPNTYHNLDKLKEKMPINILNISILIISATPSLHNNFVADYCST